MRMKPAALVLAIAGLAALPAPAPAARSCPSLRFGARSYRVRVMHGPVSCAEATKTFKAFLSGRGVEHGGRNAPEDGKTWTLAGGWTCQHDAGEDACIRGGANYVVAKDWIKAEREP